MLKNWMNSLSVKPCICSVFMSFIVLFSKTFFSNIFHSVPDLPGKYLNLAEENSCQIDRLEGLHTYIYKKKKKKQKTTLKIWHSQQKEKTFEKNFENKGDRLSTLNLFSILLRERKQHKKYLKTWIAKWETKNLSTVP